MSQSRNNRRTRIVVVDGSSVSREILRRILEEELPGASVHGCGTGRQALEHLAADQADLITTSLLLPDLEGLDLAHSIRQLEHHRYTPIIVVSGHEDPGLLRKGLNAGITDYFDKSLGYRAFGEFIKTLVQRHSGLDGRILYVEDSRTAAALTRQMLEKHGLEVVHTATAEDALALLQAAKQDRQFDIVITDLTLKGDMTGADLLHSIRAKYHFAQQALPVLVLTGHDDLQKQVDLFHAGANDFVNKPIIEEILLARVRSLLLLKHQYSALKEQAEEMQVVATTDSLTGVRSKRYLLDTGEKYLTDPANQPVCGMIIDIDHFKQINDTLGHITGDHVLEALGKILNDAYPDALVVRFGGEEFCIIVPRCDRGTALERAEQLRTTIESQPLLGRPVTVSIGVAARDDHPNGDLTQLIALADKALYHAKEGGRNRVAVHGPADLETYRAGQA